MFHGAGGTKSAHRLPCALFHDMSHSLNNCWNLLIYLRYTTWYLVFITTYTTMLSCTKCGAMNEQRKRHRHILVRLRNSRPIWRIRLGGGWKHRHLCDHAETVPRCDNTCKTDIYINCKHQQDWISQIISILTWGRKGTWKHLAAMPLTYHDWH